MTKKDANKLPRHWVYIHGYKMVQVRSIGHKWVWYRTGPSSGPYQHKFSKIRRSDWDRCWIMNEEQHIYEGKIKRYFVKHSLDFYTPCPVNKSHPHLMRRFGKRSKTIEELELEMLEHMESNAKKRGAA